MFGVEALRCCSYRPGTVPYPRVHGALVPRVYRALGLRCFDRFINTLARWWSEILNYFVERETSGFVEGFNNKIKVLKRRSHEMTNLKHLFQRVYLDLEGYRLFA